MENQKATQIFKKQVYTIIVALLLVAIIATLVITTTQVYSDEVIEKTTAKFNTQVVPLNSNFNATGKKPL